MIFDNKFGLDITYNKYVIELWPFFEYDRFLYVYMVAT